MANLQTTTISDTGALTAPNGTGAQRTVGNRTVVTFTTTGTNLTWTCPAGVTSIQALVVGGGGGGGFGHGGGGAGGAVLYNPNLTVVPGTVYTFNIGVGGAGHTSNANNNAGGSTTAFGVTATGGGSGSNESGNDSSGRGGLGGDGANGGGGTYGFVSGGNGFAPSAPGWQVFAGQQGGRGGESGTNYPTGGGAGAGGRGGDGQAQGGGGGGPGVLIDITGSPLYWGGGGGGVTYDAGGMSGAGGIGGGGGAASVSGVAGKGGGSAFNTGGDGGNGGNVTTPGTGQTGGAGGANTGGGGGGGPNEEGSGGAGGSGIVVVSYITNSTAFGQIRYNTGSNQVDTYSDANGWVPKDPLFNDATGGSVCSFGGYKYHYFNTSNAPVGTPATFTPTQTGLVELLVVAGGGGGGGNPTAGAGMSGGGAGGVIYQKSYTVVGGQSYTVSVGAGGSGGGTAQYSSGTSGQNSQFGTLIAIGGGRGGGYGNSSIANPSYQGGSGGGGGTREPTSYLGESYPGMGTWGQGNRGGKGIPGSPWRSAGGGGAGGQGSDATSTGPGSGGSGLFTNITGMGRFYGGGGGGSSYNAGQSDGGRGGGGFGHTANGGVAVPGTGGGGGGGGTIGALNSGAGGAGGSGIVVVRYRTTTIGDGSTAATAAPNAWEIKKQTGTTTDGLYWIMIPQFGPTQVYCDMNTDGGGWMHIGTFSDSNTISRNAASHIWGAPMNPTQYCGIWEDYSTYGSQTFTDNFKHIAWNYMPFQQMLMKDSGGSLRNIWRTKADNSTLNYNGWDSMSWFWQGRRWLANGSDVMPGAAGTRVFTMDIVNYGVADPVFAANGKTRILFKWGEIDGVQDGNKDRSMISHEGDVNVDAPKGIGCFTNLGGTVYYRNIVPTTEQTGDTPATAITGTHNLTLWIR